MGYVAYRDLADAKAKIVALEQENARLRVLLGWFEPKEIQDFADRYWEQQGYTEELAKLYEDQEKIG